MKVLVATEKPFAAVAVNGIREAVEKGGLELALLEKYTEKAQLLDAVKDADAIIIRSDKVDAEVLDAAKQLKIVVRAGAGYDNVDLEAATAHNVCVMNTPGQNSNAVAELALGLMVYGALGMRITHQDTLSSQVTLRDANGTLRVVHRYNNQINKAKSAEIGLKGKFETGVIKHDMTLAASYMHYDRYMFQNALSGKTYDTNLYHLQWKDLGSYLGPLVKRLPLNDSETLRSIALSDVMATKDDRWTFIAGGRLQQIIIDEYSNRSHYEETKFSPAFALVHKPTKRLSLYANYIQGLKDGDETSSSAANPNEKMKPFVAKQYEVGAKYDFGKMATMLSAFSITNAAIVRDPVTLIESANGEVRNRGLEWMFFGEPRKGTRITGGITWLNARYEKTTGGINDGKIQDGSPRTTVVFGVEQDIHGVAGLSLSARMTYNSSTYANAANTFRVAPWTRVDVGARYRFKAGDTPVTIRADVYNVFNRNYWHALDRGAVYLGAPRTFMLSMTADF